MVDIGKYVLITSGVGARGSGGSSGAIDAELSIYGTPGEAHVGSAYSFIPQIAGNNGFTIFTTGGDLPPGLSFNPLNGAITGTPTTEGEYDGISITVHDSESQASLSFLEINVTTPSYIAALMFNDALNSQYIGQVV